MRHFDKKFTHQILHNRKMLEEGLSKTDFKMLFNREKVIFTSNVYFVFLFSFNKTYIAVMKRIFPEKASSQQRTIVRE